MNCFGRAGIALTFRAAPNVDGGDCDCARGDRPEVIGTRGELVAPNGVVVAEAATEWVLLPSGALSGPDGSVDGGTFWANYAQWELVG